MANGKPMATPTASKELNMDPSEAVYLDEEVTKHYQNIVGNLNYLVQCTRYDIA